MHNPTRMCLVCRKKLSKAELIRIVKVGDEIKIDDSGKANGRGAYICKDAQCIAKCMAKKLLNRSFKAIVEENVYEALAKLNIEG